MWHEVTVHTVQALRVSDLANECWWDVGGKSRACCHAVIPYINRKAYQETGAVEFSLKFSSQVVNQWPACQLWSRISRQGGQGKSACISRHDVDFSCLQSVSATPRTLPPPDSKNQLYFPKVGNCICICSVSISLAHSYLDSGQIIFLTIESEEKTACPIVYCPV